MSRSRLRPGFLSHVGGGEDLRQTDANVQELVVVADELIPRSVVALEVGTASS